MRKCVRITWIYKKKGLSPWLPHANFNEPCHSASSTNWTVKINPVTNKDQFDYSHARRVLVWWKILFSPYAIPGISITREFEFKSLLWIFMSQALTWDSGSRPTSRRRSEAATRDTATTATSAPSTTASTAPRPRASPVRGGASTSSSPTPSRSLGSPPGVVAVSNNFNFF